MMGWTSFGQSSAESERKSQKVSACTACRTARGVFCALVGFFLAKDCGSGFGVLFFFMDGCFLGQGKIT
jgi:hypothetical protein